MMDKNRLRFEKALANLPKIKPQEFELDSDVIKIGVKRELSDVDYKDLKKSLEILKPWRKGPFNIFDILIDSEWRADLKWKRLMPIIEPLITNKIILDLGCNNGYYMFRMLGFNPKKITGLDPGIRYYYQFQLLQSYIQAKNINYHLLGVDDLPKLKIKFDTIFCLGLLYHRKSPILALEEMRDSLTKNGHLILETLIYPGDDLISFTPKNRYQEMKNVFFIPTINCLKSWLVSASYTDIRIIDITKTTTDEQRVTKWGSPVSLESFLDPNDSNKTIEGYPAPTRAILLARKK